MEINIISINKWIQTKFGLKNILFTNGLWWMLFDVHSTSGDPYILETLMTENVNEQQLKDWIKEKLK